MAILQKPVKQIEQAPDLKSISLSIGVLLKSLKNVYESSNFYKEARIVSFIDRLLSCVLSAIQKHCDLSQVIACGLQGAAAEMLAQLEVARSICKKFQDNLFITSAQ